MAEAQLAMRARRLRAIGFIKSGWIWCIKNLEGYVKSKRGAAREDKSVKTYGRPKGKASPARFIARAIIKNFAESARTTTPDPLGKFGEPGLQKAIDYESKKSMVEYMEKKLRSSAQSLGIKTN